MLTNHKTRNMKQSGKIMYNNFLTFCILIAGVSVLLRMTNDPPRVDERTRVEAGELRMTKSVFAQESISPSPTETPTDTPDEGGVDTIKQKINDLKERLATRVAELQSQNKRAFFGIITTKEDGKLTISYKDTEILVVADSEVVIISQPINGKSTQSSLDSLESGQSIVVFGSLDVDQKTLIGSRIIAQELPTVITGNVTAVDTKAGTFTVMDTNDTTIVLDYEIKTNCSTYVTEQEDINKCGLSKLTAGDRVFIRSEPDDNDLNRATALRILVIPTQQEAQ